MPRDRSSVVGRIARHRRIRRKVEGVSERPRMAVFRSHKHIYVQVIDDGHGVTLATASSLDSEVRDQRNGKPKCEVSSIVGSLIARRAIDSGINTVVFDRGGYKYHGRVKAIAEAARKEGLLF